MHNLLLPFLAFFRHSLSRSIRLVTHRPIDSLTQRPNSGLSSTLDSRLWTLGLDSFLAPLHAAKPINFTSELVQPPRKKVIKNMYMDSHKSLRQLISVLMASIDLITRLPLYYLRRWNPPWSIDLNRHCADDSWPARVRSFLFLRGNSRVGR